VILPLWVLRAGGLLKRLWPLLAVAAVLLALWGWGGHRERQGVMAERQTWQEAARQLKVLRTEKANAAALDLAQASAEVPAVAEGEIVRVETRWLNRPVRECFDANLVRELEASRAAVRRSTAPGPSDG